MNKTVLKQVKKAYADCHDNKDFEITKNIRELNFFCGIPVNPSEAKKIMKEVCQRYNNFKYEVFDLFPDDCRVFLAREGSVCFYIEKGKKKLPTQNELGCDEYDLVNGKYRIWFD